MDIEIVRADPAGNITIFVLSPIEGREGRAAVVNALMAEPSLKAEQVGFVIPPAAALDSSTRWRLEMMGGEFCGNAARSFGIYVAGRLGLCGRHTIPIEISGMARPLQVQVDTAAGTAEVELPGPLEETSVEIEGQSLPVYVFEGITHVIACDIEGDEALVHALVRHFSDKAPTPDAPPAALGVMFYDSRKNFMRPAVWVAAAKSLVWESSCGSGSAAFGAWALRDVQDGEKTIALAQSGGVIQVRAAKREGRIQYIAIGGRVSLSEARRIVVDGEKTAASTGTEKKAPVLP
jgi:diaminopimelate epimerase